MESEIQILLNELIEAINKPDWWSIVITTINAVIVIWLGFKQYELQKRQTDAQEYQVYKSLYDLISRINQEMRNFLKLLCNSCHSTYYNMNKDLLADKLEYLENLKKEFERNQLDYNLKFNESSFDVHKYLLALSHMIDEIKFMKKAISEDQFIFDTGSTIIHFGNKNEDIAIASHIANHFKGNIIKGFAFNDIKQFIELKDVLLGNNNILTSISQKCKIDL